jgi:hypothetical protein
MGRQQDRSARVSSPVTPSIRVLLTIAAFLPGCAQSEFVRTDSGFTPAAATKRPPVYVDRVPPIPYRSVGIIQVKASSQNSLPLILREAGDKGQELGCEFVLDRVLFEVNKGAPQGSPYGTPYAPAYVAPPQIREFICGMIDRTPRPPVAPAMVTVPVPATAGQPGGPPQRPDFPATVAGFTFGQAFAAAAAACKNSGLAWSMSVADSSGQQARCSGTPVSMRWRAETVLYFQSAGLDRIVLKLWNDKSPGAPTYPSVEADLTQAYGAGASRPMPVPAECEDEMEACYKDGRAARSAVWTWDRGYVRLLSGAFEKGDGPTTLTIDIGRR